MLSEKHMQTRTLPKPLSAIRAAFKLTMPIFMAFLPLGLAFGFIGQELGLPWYAMVMLSGLVYAGSSEFVAAAMMAAGETTMAVVFTSLLVNFRHVFYGLSVFDKIPATGLLRYYVIATLSDETYALIASMPSGGSENTTEFNRAQSIWIAVFNHAYWFVSVILGYLLHSGLDLQLPGLEFILTALFVVLTIEKAKQLRKAFPFGIALICGLVSWLVAPKQMLVVAIMFSVVVLIIMSTKQQPQQEVEYVQ